MTPIEQHNIDVEDIRTHMKRFCSRGQKVKVYHGSTNSTRAQEFEKDKIIDINRLDRIIETNTNERYVIAEPNVPMDKLVNETLRYHLLPPVVMEFPGITVGGAIQGGAGESSFKYGLFHDTCMEYEIVLGNGDLITTSPTQNEDLFFGTACSYGTLGIITLVKLRLVPAKSYVHLAYHAISNHAEMVNFLEKSASETVDFVDGIMSSKNRGVAMIGYFTDENRLPVSTFSKRSDEWFYLHADAISKLHTMYEEVIPVREYLFRYDRGGFWVGCYFFTYWKIPFTKLTRYLLDKVFKTRTLYRFVHAMNISQQYFVQDLSLPKESVLEFLRFVEALSRNSPSIPTIIPENTPHGVFSDTIVRGLPIKSLLL